MAQTSEEIKLAKAGCLLPVDFILLVLVILLAIPFKDFYVPWKAKVYGEKRTNVREGPSTDYPIVRQLQVGQKVTIVGQEGDWYYLSYDPRQMVREDTMEAIPSKFETLIVDAIFQLLAQPQFLLLIVSLWVLQLIRAKARKELLAQLD